MQKKRSTLDVNYSPFNYKHNSVVGAPFLRSQSRLGGKSA
jgi:hypothetical protein